MDTRRVYLSFFARAGWVVQFSPPSLDRALGRLRTLPTEQAVRDLIARTPTPLTPDDRDALDTAFAVGRGGLFLELTATQYAALFR